MNAVCVFWGVWACFPQSSFLPGKCGINAPKSVRALTVAACLPQTSCRAGCRTRAGRCRPPAPSPAPVPFPCLLPSLPYSIPAFFPPSLHPPRPSVPPSPAFLARSLARSPPSYQPPSPLSLAASAGEATPQPAGRVFLLCARECFQFLVCLFAVLVVSFLVSLPTVTRLPYQPPFPLLPTACWFHHPTPYAPVAPPLLRVIRRAEPPPRSVSAPRPLPPRIPPACPRCRGDVRGLTAVRV